MTSKEQEQGKKEISDTVAASRFWAHRCEFEGWERRRDAIRSRCLLSVVGFCPCR